MIPFKIAFDGAPSSWRRLPMSAVVSQRKVKNEKLIERNLLSLSYGRIIKKNIDSADGLLPENFEGYNIVEENDVVLRFTDLQNDQRSLRTGQVKERGIITSAYLTVTPNSGFHPRFVHYLLHGLDLMKLFYTMGDGLRQSVVFDDFKRIPVVIPDFAVQTAIADYLDRKTAAIDALIAKKELLIEELRKYQEAVIAEAVAPREGWRKYKVKQLLKAQPKSNLPSGAGDELGAFPFYVSGAEIKRIAEPMLKGTAILMADGGKASLHLGKGEFSWSDHVLCLLSGDEAVTEFVYNQLSVQLAFLDGHGFRGTGLPMLDKRWLYEDLAIWLPKTRTEILKFNAEILEIRNHYLKRSQNVIATIQELKAYRSALISEAVTGKLPL